MKTTIQRLREACIRKLGGFTPDEVTQDYCEGLRDGYAIGCNLDRSLGIVPALATLSSLGYTFRGGSRWVPPLGLVPRR